MDSPYQGSADVHVLPTNLSLPGVGVLPINAYLIMAEEPVLIDSGIGIDADQFMDAVSSIVDLRTLSPIDRETVLASVARTNRALLLHEATLTGGIGGELAAIVAGEGFEYLDAPIVRLGSLDAPVPYAPALEAAFLPNAARVVEAAEKLVRY